MKLWEGLDSRHRFENTDVNMDGSAVVANGPEAVYEDHRKEQAQTGDLQQLESVSREVFENIRSDSPETV